MPQSPEGGPPIKIVVSSRSESLDEQDAWEDEEEDEMAWEDPPTDPPPSLHMPVASTLEVAEVVTLDERIFDLAGDLWGEEPDAMFRMTLDVVLEVVPCEAAAISRQSLLGSSLELVDARGPVAAALKARTLAVGEGLAGLCAARGATLRADDSQIGDYHVAAEGSGGAFECTAALAVPVLDEDGMVYGVVELLNPTSLSFLDEDEEAIEKVAQVLGQALAEG